MKIIGTTDKGCIVEMTDSELAHASGFATKDEFGAYLLKNAWSAPPEFLGSRTVPATGIELPIGEWFHQLIMLRSLLPVLKYMGRELRENMARVDKAAALLAPIYGDPERPK